jgi:flagellar hook-associated protein 1 FlgK
VSLFSSLQIANNALIAYQTGLQVTGNNIANANTPGYLRQQVVLSPAPTQRVGDLTLGLGVQVDGVVQQRDEFLNERLRLSTSDRASAEAQEDTYVQLETIIGELSDTDLSTSLTNFFGSINDILNQPENESVRNLAVLKGDTLAQDIRRLNDRVREVQSDVNEQINGAATDINRLLSNVADLNIKVVTTEGGGASKSDAVGIRDQRDVALKELSGLIDIQVREQKDGSVTVLSNGEYLVAAGEYRPVAISNTTTDGVTKTQIQLQATDAPIQSNSGRVAGLVSARDDILGGFLDGLNEFAEVLTFEFNKVFSSGQGLSGYSSLSSTYSVDNINAPLDAAGLPFTPNNGSFEIKLTDQQTGLSQTHEIDVKLTGLGDETSLQELADAINAIDGLSSSVSATRGLTISSDSANTTFSFANDTSGALAALGLNTFFTGSSAGDINVNAIFRNDPAKFAASSGGVGNDTDNAVELASFIDKQIATSGGASVSVLYEQLVGETTQAASVTKSVAEGFRTYEQTLVGQQLAFSGVSLDEEAVNMLTYQRAYQASARFIATVNELLEVLVNL